MRHFQKPVMEKSKNRWTTDIAYFQRSSRGVPLVPQVIILYQLKQGVALYDFTQLKHCRFLGKIQGHGQFQVNQVTKEQLS